MKRIKKALSISILSTMLGVMMLVPSTLSISAQEGGGIDVCTYYNANGFKSQNQCEKYYDAVKRKNTPEWTKKMNKCLAFAGGATAAQSWAKMIVGWKMTTVTFSSEFIGCMFI